MKFFRPFSLLNHQIKLLTSIYLLKSCISFILSLARFSKISFCFKSVRNSFSLLDLTNCFPCSFCSCFSSICFLLCFSMFFVCFSKAFPNGEYLSLFYYLSLIIFLKSDLLKTSIVRNFYNKIVSIIYCNIYGTAK